MAARQRAQRSAHHDLPRGRQARHVVPRADGSSLLGEPGHDRHHQQPPATRTATAFDAPETTAFIDHTSRTLFSADSFGALLQSPTADAADLDTGDLADGMALWSTIDSPWLTHTGRGHFDRTVGEFRDLDAQRVLSSHLPPAHGLTDRLLDNLARVPGSEPWVGPDQAALDQILTSVTA